MPNISNWVSTNRAGDAWNRIQDRPTEITIIRDEVEMPSQIVRVEEESTPSEVVGAGGNKSSRLQATVFGIKGHPYLPDTNIAAGDHFKARGTIYRVIHVIQPEGEIQAMCEAQS